MLASGSSQTSAPRAEDIALPAAVAKDLGPSEAEIMQKHYVSVGLSKRDSQESDMPK